MTTHELTFDLAHPDGTALTRAPITAELVTVQHSIYKTAAGVQLLAGIQTSATTDDDGEATLNLIPNPTITPNDSYYRICAAGHSWDVIMPDADTDFSTLTPHPTPEAVTLDTTTKLQATNPPTPPSTDTLSTNTLTLRFSLPDGETPEYVTAVARLQTPQDDRLYTIGTTVLLDDFSVGASDTDGTITLDLTPNGIISPADSHYEIVITAGSSVHSWDFIMPAENIEFSTLNPTTPESPLEAGKSYLALQEDQTSAVTKLLTLTERTTTNADDKLYLVTNDGTPRDRFVKVSTLGVGGEANVQSDWDEADTNSAAHILNKPTLAPTTAEQNVQADWNVTDTASDAHILNKPTLAPSTAEQNVQADWNVSDSSSDAHILNKPTLAPSNAEQNVQANWSQTDTSSDAYIQNKPQIVCDWDESDSASDGYIDNKPTLPAANQLIPAGGTNGQALIKASDTDRDVEWGTVATSGGGGGGTSFLAVPENNAISATHFFLGWASVDGGWLVRRIVRQTALSADATVSNNAAVTTFTAAWAARTTLQYA